MTMDAAMDVLPAPVIEEMESAQEAFENWIERVCSDLNEVCSDLNEDCIPD